MDVIKSFLSRKANHFHVVTILLFALSTYNIIYKISFADGLQVRENLWNPTWLAFGPLLYFGLQKARGIHTLTPGKVALHFLPSLLFLICFVIAYFTTDHNDPWESSTYAWYQNSYLVIMISLVSYSCHTLWRLLETELEVNNPPEMLLMSFAALYILISVITFMIFFSWVIIKVDMGLDYRFFTYAFLLFANIATIWYWMRPPVKKHEDDVEEEIKAPEYSKSELAPELVAAYQAKITGHFEEKPAYLTPSLSLDNLSKDLDIPKHYLSQIFNVHFKKSFHSFLADYRIAHAIKLLNEQPRLLKIESLANACGFNSKTSFNKYFKEITGLSPSVYQENLISRKGNE